MEERLTFLNFSKKISSALLKKSEKLIVRDIDEEKPNSFVAYVDQDKDSYDVAIEVSDKNEIINSSCECNSKGFCIHKIAFLNYLSKKNAKKVKSPRKKKRTQSEELIEELDQNALRNWVIQLLKKNKDLELLFVNEFSISKVEYSKSDVKLLIENSIKSVIKNKKNVEINELKKIIELLEITLKPVIEYCKADLSNKERLEMILFVIEGLIDFNNRIFTTSVRLIRYIEKIPNEIIAEITSITDENKWEDVVDLNFKIIFYDSKQSISNMIFDYMVSLYRKEESNIERKKYYAKKLKEFFLYVNKNEIRLGIAISNFVIEVITENNLFEELFQYFKPVRYENDFNLTLIDSLIAINQISLAENYATQQVANNYYVEFNFEYWKRLKTIYTLQENEKKLVAILMNTVNIDFNFDDYLMIKETIPALEFKKFRSNLLGKAKRSFDKNKQAVVFYFKVLFSEKSFNKMIENICCYTDYELVYLYKEELYLTDKLGFLDKLTTIESKWFSQKGININFEYREKLMDWVLTKYDEIILTAFLKNKL
ncbi:hypothetical protein [Flavobacterium sp. ZB4R12]|uniref:hypothetical protein n=1 Tax=Flavobacterium sp. ZB4R12 TaxID=3398732 RepID=UPI003AAE30EE